MSKCTRCNKTVYHAERKEHDGLLFHAGCFNLWKKDKEAAETRARNERSYEKPADVSPAYYRTGDGGHGPRMETGSEYKGVSGGGFCTSCGSQLSSGVKFCGNCGTASN